MELTKYICHRKPERSFHIKNHQFPVCARCTGFYIGLITYLICNLFYTHNYDFNMLIISVILMIPVAIDGFTQYAGLRESTNNLRLITGFIGGIGLIIFLKIIIRGFHMFCRKCGEENLEEAVFCKNCGARLKEEEVKKATVIETPTEKENTYTNQNRTTTTTTSSNNGDSGLLSCCICLIGIFIIFAIIGLF